MRLNVEALARDLGKTQDFIRICLGIPTEKQRLIRSAKSWIQIKGLESTFERESYRSCGPTHEPEEEKEYRARRAELFTEYLRGLDTMEKLHAEDSDRLLEVERKQVAEKFATLFQKQIDEAGDSLPDLKLLEALISDHHYHQTHANAFARLSSKMREILLARLMASQTTEEAITALLEIQKYDYDFHLGLCHSSERRQWSFVWDRTGSISELLLLVETVPSAYLDGNFIETKMNQLLREQFESFNDFETAMRYASQFKHLDKQGKPSDIYSRALGHAADQITHKSELREWMRVWNLRAEIVGAESLRREGCPFSYTARWDDLHKNLIGRKLSKRQLELIIQSAPRVHSRVRKWTEEQLLDMYRTAVDAAVTTEELDEVYKSFDFYTDNKWTIKDARAKVLKRVEMYKLARTTEDVNTLLEIFREVRRCDGEEDKEIMSLIVRKLAPHYPAIDMDVIPEPVGSA